ncbi:MAG TPA: MarR family transcriptional regulator [Marmoricola sp.]|jgi:DNA-binding MarR family transcriptional regulator|nr:MarR family transcriptional regulator [Marmoricola sp.]
MTTTRQKADERRDVAVRTLEHEIALLLRRIRRGMSERALQVHPELNATSYALLATLGEFGPRRAAELAEMFAMDKGAVSRVVHQLLELGLVQRTPDPVDGRASIIAVTEAATERLAHMHELRRELFDAQLSDWPADEIEQLATQLGRFNIAVFDAPAD